MVPTVFAAILLQSLAVVNVQSDSLCTGDCYKTVTGVSDLNFLSYSDYCCYAPKILKCASLDKGFRICGDSDIVAIKKRCGEDYGECRLGGGAIAGIVIGTLAGLVILVSIVYKVMRKN